MERDNKKKKYFKIRRKDIPEAPDLPYYHHMLWIIKGYEKATEKLDMIEPYTRDLEEKCKKYIKHLDDNQIAIRNQRSEINRLRALVVELKAQIRDLRAMVDGKL